MVCNRCKLAVKRELEKLELHPMNVALGEVLIYEDSLSKEQLGKLSESLEAIGFELIDDKKSQLIEKVKSYVIETVHYNEKNAKVKFSVLLSRHLHHDYSFLSNLFSEVEGITIEQYVLLQKIEKVKELLMYDQLSLTEIAFQLGYSSTAHLSAQFKKLTGLTASAFKQLTVKTRKPLDEVGRGK